jgi:hypothetical protein
MTTAGPTTAPPTKEQFSGQLNGTFRASAPNGREFEMSLSEFRDILDSDTQETFTLIFRAPSDLEPEQGTYIVANDSIGEQAIFLVPVRRDESGLYFEAVYNRFKK